MIEIPDRAPGSLTIVLADSGEGKTVAANSLRESSVRRYTSFGELPDKLFVEQSHYNSPPIAQEKSLIQQIAEIDFLQCKKCLAIIEKQSVNNIIKTIVGDDHVTIKAAFPSEAKDTVETISAERGHVLSTIADDSIHLTIDSFATENNKQRMLDAVREALSIAASGVVFQTNSKVFAFSESGLCPNCGAIKQADYSILKQTVDEASLKLTTLSRMIRIGLGKTTLGLLVASKEGTINTLCSLPADQNSSLIVIDDAFTFVELDMIPKILEEFRLIASNNNLIYLFTAREEVAKFALPAELLVVGEAPITETTIQIKHNKRQSYTINPAENYKINKTSIADFFSISKELAELFSTLPEAKIRGLKAKSFINQEQISRDIKFKERSFKDLLSIKLEHSLELLKNIPKISRPLSIINFSALGYLSLDRKLSTLSAGEWRRLAIIKELIRLPKAVAQVSIVDPIRHLRTRSAKKFIDALIVSSKAELAQTSPAAEAESP